MTRISSLSFIAAYATNPPNVEHVWYRKQVHLLERVFSSTFPDNSFAPMKRLLSSGQVTDQEKHRLSQALIDIRHSIHKSPTFSDFAMRSDSRLAEAGIDAIHAFDSHPDLRLTLEARRMLNRHPIGGSGVINLDCLFRQYSRADFEPFLGNASQMLDLMDRIIILTGMDISDPLFEIYDYSIRDWGSPVPTAENIEWAVKRARILQDRKVGWFYNFYSSHMTSDLRALANHPDPDLVHIAALFKEWMVTNPRNLSTCWPVLLEGKRVISSIVSGKEDAEALISRFLTDLRIRWEASCQPTSDGTDSMRVATSRPAVARFVYSVNREISTFNPSHHSLRWYRSPLEAGVAALVAATEQSDLEWIGRLDAIQRAVVEGEKGLTDYQLDLISKEVVPAISLVRREDVFAAGIEVAYKLRLFGDIDIFGTDPHFLGISVSELRIRLINQIVSYLVHADITNRRLRQIFARYMESVDYEELEKFASYLERYVRSYKRFQLTSTSEETVVGFLPSHLLETLVDNDYSAFHERLSPPRRARCVTDEELRGRPIPEERVRRIMELAAQESDQLIRVPELERLVLSKFRLPQAIDPMIIHRGSLKFTELVGNMGTLYLEKIVPMVTSLRSVRTENEPNSELFIVGDLVGAVWAAIVESRVDHNDRVVALLSDLVEGISTVIAIMHDTQFTEVRALRALEDVMVKFVENVLRPLASQSHGDLIEVVRNLFRTVGDIRRFVATRSVYSGRVAHRWTVPE